MPANNSTEDLDTLSHLLALPVELLQRVSNNLSDETLLMFRLTCKPIETATFDRFAKTFFGERCCYIYYKPRWTMLKDVVSSRMADRIRRVVFTNAILAPNNYGTLQLAPNKHEQHGAHGCYFPKGNAQHKAYEAMAETVGTRTQIPSWPNEGVIERCLLDIRNLTPNVLVNLSFADSNECELEEDRIVLRASVLVGLAASRVRLTTFNTAAPGITTPVNIARSLGYDSSSHLRSIQSFTFSENHSCIPDLYARQCITGFLGSIAELRSLSLILDQYNVDFEDDNYDPHQTVAKMLLANRFSHLERLRLEDLSVMKADLVETLSRCKHTLLEVDMAKVRVVGSDSAWLKVFGVLASMTRLSRLSLSALEFNDSDENYFTFVHLTDEDDDDDMTFEDNRTEYEGRGQVIAGLEKLLTGSLKIVDY